MIRDDRREVLLAVPVAAGRVAVIVVGPLGGVKIVAAGHLDVLARVAGEAPSHSSGLVRVPARRPHRVDGSQRDHTALDRRQLQLHLHPELVAVMRPRIASRSADLSHPDETPSCSRRSDSL